MSSQAQLLAALLADQKPTPTCMILPEAQIELLREILQVYSKPCLYSPGDLVHPCLWAPILGRDSPHLVLAVLPSDEIRPVTESGDVTSGFFGARVDMRVASVHPTGGVTFHWVESFMWEPYDV